MGNRPLEQRCRHTLSTTARADHDAHDAPHRQVIDGPDETRAGQACDLGAGADVAPSHRLAVPIGHHPRGMVAFAQAPHGLLTASATELLDLTSPQPVGETPAMVGAAGVVDDVSEILAAVPCHRVCLPRPPAT